MKFLLFVILSFCSLVCHAQCVEQSKAIKVGEVLHYSAYYNWGLIWVKAGVATFSVEEEEGNYKFTVKTDNVPAWGWLYSVHSLHEASISKDFRPIYMRSVSEENGVKAKEYYRYSADGTTIEKTYKYGDDEEKKEIFKQKECSWDIINMVYIARSYNVRGATPDETIPFSVMFNNKYHTIYGKVLGKETIKNRNGKSYSCLKCTATVASGTIFKDGEPVYVWITDDDAQIPILVESKISIGSIKVYLD